MTPESALIWLQKTLLQSRRRIFLAYISLDGIPLIAYFGWDWLDGGIGSLIPSTYAGVIANAVTEELWFRFLFPGLAAIAIGYVITKRKAMRGVAPALMVFTLLWALAHPLKGQPWVKLISLLPAGILYMTLWFRTFNIAWSQYLAFHVIDQSAFSRAGIQVVLRSAQWGGLAILAHAITNIAAVLLWRAASTDS